MLERKGKKTIATEARHRITIQAKNSTTDGEGGFADSWTDDTTCWAALYPMHAVQQYLYKSVNVDATHLIKIRALSMDVFPEWNRIKFGTRIFEILTVENIQERDFQKMITCKERR